MTKRMTIGLIGLDTSHVTAFAELLNNPDNPHHVPGGTVTAAFPGGSPDLFVSHSRVEGFTNDLRDKYGVAILDTVEAVAEAVDAIMIESVDGRVHLDYFRRVAPYGKPVFIDKPMVLSSADARELAAIAKQYNVPVMSSSSLRYSESLLNGLAEADKGAVTSAEAYTPMSLEPTNPGYYFYGIHGVETLYAIYGPGCQHVSAVTADGGDVVVGVWKDGRVGTVRGNHKDGKGTGGYGAILYREKGVQAINAYLPEMKPFYASLLEQVMTLFQTGVSPLAFDETIEIMRFIEAANESRETGSRVAL